MSTRPGGVKVIIIIIVTSTPGHNTNYVSYSLLSKRLLLGGDLVNRLISLRYPRAIVVVQEEYRLLSARYLYLIEYARLHLTTETEINLLLGFFFFSGYC